MPASSYTVKITDDFGASSITLTKPFDMSVIVDELNGPGSFTFSLAMTDAQATGIDVWTHEVIVLRAATVLFIGPIVLATPSSDATVITFTCAGPLAYFQQRNIDRGAGRTNLLSNGDFETGSVGAVPTGWTAVGVTAEVDNTDHVLGSKCVKLTQANPGTNTYLQQTISNFDPSGVGDLLTVKVFVKVSAADWAGPALEHWGLVIKQTVVGDPTTPVGGEQSFRADATITSDTRRDTWDVRLEDTIQIGTSNVDVIVRLMAPGGVTRYDLAGVFKSESFSPRDVTVPGLGVDQAEILIQLVDFLQGNLTGLPSDKSDLLITADGTSCPATGVLRLVSYQFADHMASDGPLLAFCGLDDGVDVWIDVSRVFHTAHPRRGTDRTATVTATLGVNCIFAGGVHDGRQAANQVVQLGSGDGPDREEGAADDGTAFGGITLQKIIQATGSPSVDSLDASAVKALATAKQPKHYEVELIAPTDGSTDLRYLLQLGDTITTAWSVGWLQETGTMRVITRSINPISDTVTVGLNVEP